MEEDCQAGGSVLSSSSSAHRISPRIGPSCPAPVGCSPPSRLAGTRVWGRGGGGRRPPLGGAEAERCRRERWLSRPGLPGRGGAAARAELRWGSRFLCWLPGDWFPLISRTGRGRLHFLPLHTSLSLDLSPFPPPSLPPFFLSLFPASPKKLQPPGLRDRGCRHPVEGAHPCAPR